MNSFIYKSIANECQISYLSLPLESMLSLDEAILDEADALPTSAGFVGGGGVV